MLWDGTVQPQSTCWDLVRGAASGSAELQEEFARRYAGVVRSCLDARWRSSALGGYAEDAVQEVLLECVRPGGALERADPERGSFRGFLYGVTCNVARRVEKRCANDPGQVSDLERFASREDSVSRVFDRAWAQAVVREAARLQELRAREEAQVRRVELLRLRFERDMPTREIARLWNVEPIVIQRQYKQARIEFSRALHDVLAAYQGGSPGDLQAEIERIIQLLE